MTEFETEILEIIELTKNIPNNQDLGKRFRSLYGTKKIVRSIPNDSDLGSELRRLLNQGKESTDLLEKLKNIEIKLSGLKNI